MNPPGRPSSTAAALFLAARPRTLVAALVPVAVGSALAARAGAFQPLLALGALVGALFIQVGTNLANDYFDYVRGADTGARLGPPRATQQGWLSPRAVLTAALVSFGLALVLGVFLVAAAGWPLLVIGLASLVAGYAYTGGPYPLAYHGLGDVFVFVFFGLVAVGGTYFLQAGAPPSLEVWLAAVPVGALGVALLAVNNTRDVDTDAQAGKRTLVVRLGVAFGRAEYLAMVGLAAAVPLVLLALGLADGWILVPLLTLPLAVTPARLVLAERGAGLNRALALTARFQLLYGLALAAGLLGGRPSP